MKHASDESLATIGPLLARLRALGGLVERRPGIFYRRSAAFLHFHEDPAGLHADVKLDARVFQRMRIATGAEQERLIDAVRRALGSAARGSGRAR